MKSTTTFVAWALTLLLSGPVYSQQAFDPATVVPDPMVENLAREAADGDTITALSGHVGPSTADTVRLYTDLTLTRFVEIPRAAILQQVAGSTAGSPVKLYVRGATVVVVAARLSADKAAALGRPAPASSLARSIPGATPINAACQLACSYCAGGGAGATSFAAACVVCIACAAEGGVPLPDLLAE